jgi:hypothetical protein
MGITLTAGSGVMFGFFAGSCFERFGVMLGFFTDSCLGTVVIDGF